MIKKNSNVNIDTHFLIKVLRQEVSEEEKEVFEIWLNQSDENKEEFGRIALLWEKIGTLPTPLSPDPEKEWLSFCEKLETLEDKRNAYRKNLSETISTSNSDEKLLYISKINRYIWPFRIVAIFLIFFLIYQLLGRVNTKQELIDSPKSENKEYTLVVSKGEKATVPLYDGSIIYLNSESKLIYPKFFDKVRKVKLEGEGYFLIKSDPDKPFMVETENKIIEVKGTEFNLRYRNGKLSLVVTNGRVTVYIKDSSKIIDVNKGELTEYHPEFGFTIPRKVNTRFYTAWRENKLFFDKTSFQEVMEEIDRFYNVNSVFKNKKVRTKKLTGFFDSNSLDEILNKISIALDAKIERQGKNIYIY